MKGRGNSTRKFEQYKAQGLTSGGSSSNSTGLTFSNVARVFMVTGGTAAADAVFGISKSSTTAEAGRRTEEFSRTCASFLAVGATSIVGASSVAEGVLVANSSPREALRSSTCDSLGRWVSSDFAGGIGRSAVGAVRGDWYPGARWNVLHACWACMLAALAIISEAEWATHNRSNRTLGGIPPRKGDTSCHHCHNSPPWHQHMYIDRWEDFQEAAEALYDKAPVKVFGTIDCRVECGLISMISDPLHREVETRGWS